MDTDYAIAIVWPSNVPVGPPILAAAALSGGFFAPLRLCVNVFFVTPPREPFFPRPLNHIPLSPAQSSAAPMLSLTRGEQTICPHNPKLTAPTRSSPPAPKPKPANGALLSTPSA